MSSTPPRHRLVVATTALALVLAGCAGGSSGDTSSSTTGGPAAGGSGGDALRVASSDPENMIPGNSYAFYLQQLMFDPLTRLDAETGEVVPLVAESVESDDQKEWTVVLREGTTFHDGEKVTAQSYADAWSATAYAPNAWVNSSYFTNIEGYGDLNPTEGDPTTDKLSGVEVVSDTELKITLVEPNGLFPYTLANPALAPLPSVAFDDFEAFNKKPVGNGAFQIDGEYTPASTYKVKAYPDYQGEKPKVQAIDMIPYTDRSTAFNDLLAGNLDTVYPIPAQRLKEMESKLAGKFSQATIPNLNYFAMPMWDKRFEDPRVREAISMAIDRESITSTILAGNAAPAFSMAPESAVGARPDTCTACSFDPEGAKKLLEEAGGFEGQLVLYGSQYTLEDQVLQAISNQLSTNLDIEVTMKLDPEAYNKFREQDVDGPTLSYWGSYFPHIEAMVEPLFSPNGAGNITGYDNPEVTSLLKEGNATSGEDAIGFYQEAEDIALKDMYIIPLYFGVYTAAWGDRVESVPTGPNGYGNLGQTVLTP